MPFRNIDMHADRSAVHVGSPAMTAHSFTTLMAFSNSTYKMLCSHPCTHQCHTESAFKGWLG